MGKTFDLRPYTINDFKEWDERKELILSPKFQRRRVWSEKAKSYLIDTILRGLPIPPVFIRQKIDPNTHKTIREVIDGQQRLGTILDFINNGFKILKIHNENYGNLYFSDISSSDQEDFLQYLIGVNVVSNKRDEQILEIFARLNTYTVKLNNQELWNAKYFGLFKQTVHSLAYEFYTFWINSKIISEQKITRMYDVELTSELVIASIDGIKEKKVIEDYYDKYDDEFIERDNIKKKFKKCIDTIGEIYGEYLPTSHFNGGPLFYTLYCVIFELLFGLKNSSFKGISRIKQDKYYKVKAALENFEAMVEEENNKSEINSDLKQFIEDITRHTTIEKVRKRRHDYLMKYIIKYLK